MSLHTRLAALLLAALLAHGIAAADGERRLHLGPALS